MHPFVKIIVSLWPCYAISKILRMNMMHTSLRGWTEHTNQAHATEKHLYDRSVGQSSPSYRKHLYDRSVGQSIPCYWKTLIRQKCEAIERPMAQYPLIRQKQGSGKSLYDRGKWIIQMSSKIIYYVNNLTFGKPTLWNDFYPVIREMRPMSHALEKCFKKHNWNPWNLYRDVYVIHSSFIAYVDVPPPFRSRQWGMKLQDDEGLLFYHVLS